MVDQEKCEFEEQMSKEIEKVVQEKQEMIASYEDKFNGLAMEKDNLD